MLKESWLLRTQAANVSIYTKCWLQMQQTPQKHKTLTHFDPIRMRNIKLQCTLIQLGRNIVEFHLLPCKWDRNRWKGAAEAAQTIRRAPVGRQIWLDLKRAKHPQVGSGRPAWCWTIRMNRSVIAVLFPSQRRAGSHGARVTAAWESGDVLLPATPSMTGLAVAQKSPLCC